MNFFCYNCNQESLTEICKCGSIAEWLMDYEDLEDDCNHEAVFDFGDGVYCGDCGQMITDTLTIGGQKIHLENNREETE